MNQLTTFESRLDSWNQLRNQVKCLPLKEALEGINLWWFNLPWTAYHLHWDDKATWPDPWELLSDNIFCEVARGLGIMYTITLLDRADMMSAELVLTNEGHNLVQVDESKYILNWNKTTIVNIIPEVKRVEKRLKYTEVKQQYT